MVVRDWTRLASLRHPVRKEIIAAMTLGKEDFITEKTEEVKKLDDGTRITQTLVVKRPSTRFWLTIPEILDNARRINPKSSITSRQCYYHMHELVNLGLVEQYPEQPKSNKKNSRIRGLYFKPFARIFIPAAQEYGVEMLESLFGIEFSDDQELRLKKAIETTENKFAYMTEKLAAKIRNVPIDFDTLSLLLIRLADIFLSDDAEAIQSAEELKGILGTKLDIS
jgi:hypothetical protein